MSGRRDEWHAFFSGLPGPGRCSSFVQNPLRGGFFSVAMVTQEPAPCRKVEMEDKMRRSILLLAIVGMLVAALAIPAIARGDGNPNPQPQVYVTSQGLTYDSIVVTDLPQKGRFQQLIPVEGVGLTTEFGPGDPGYLGGRWWLDVNEDGMMNDGDMFFLCPLLGPGF